MAKKVVVFSTAGRTGQVVDTNALNWEQLKKDLSAKGISHQGMKAVVGASKVTLENPEAVIPEEDFNLFLFPVKTKSGAFNQKQADALSYGDLKAAIKDCFSQDKDGADAHFNAGKNWTNKSTADLRTLLVNFKPSKKGAAKKAAPAPEPVKTKTVSKAVAKAASAKKEEKKSASKAVVKSPSKAVVPAKKETKGKVADIVKSVATTKKVERTKAVSANDTAIDKIVGDIRGLSGKSTDKEAAVSAILRLKEDSVIKSTGSSKLVTDNRKLEDEARKLGRGFSDIKSF